jgi:hypothetical protein
VKLDECDECDCRCGQSAQKAIMIDQLSVLSFAPVSSFSSALCESKRLRKRFSGQFSIEMLMSGR